MANTSGFFSDVNYGPDDFTSYFRDFYTDGVMADDTNYFAVSQKDGMTLTVNHGVAYIDGHFYRPPLDVTITLGDSDTEYPRIDLVVIKCDYVKKEIYIDVVTGEPLAEPQIPEMERDAAAYCLGLAAVTVAANTSEITQADIKDLRLDESYCGVVVGKINTISTAALFAQYEAQWELLKAGCAQDADAVIAAWDALNTVKRINDIEPIGGNIELTQSLIPSDGAAYQMPYYIQSGTLSVDTNSHKGINITFPKAFKEAPLLLFSATYYKGNANFPITANYSNLTKNGFMLVSSGINSGGLSNTVCIGTVNWVALGVM